MTQETLKYISDTLTAAGINYEFGEWTSDIVYPYFTGEYQETPATSEDGLQETSFILNGFSRGSYLDLENAKRTIENLFAYCATILDTGTGLCVDYDNAFIVPTNDAELKRIQINLSIKEWRLKNG